VFASCLLFCSEGQARERDETNEVRWRASIEADIRNDAPKEQVCSNAMSSARVSDDARFKDWAYGIARQYCSADKFNKHTRIPPTGSAPSQSSQRSDCPILSAIDARKIVNGQRIKLMGGGCVMIFN
jgi:hypothetical protein